MCLCFIRTQEALFGSVQTVEECFPGAFTSLLLPRVSHLCSDVKQTERRQGLRERVGALKQATCQGKAVETGMGEQGHLGRLAGPACPCPASFLHTGPSREQVFMDWIKTSFNTPALGSRLEQPHCSWWN